MASTAAPVPSEQLRRPLTAETTPEEGLLERVVDAVDRKSVWVLAALLALAGAVVMYMGHGLSFYYDDWEWVLHDYGGGTYYMLHPHVGNISFFPAALYKVLFQLVGLNHYAVFRLEVVVLHLICGALIYVMAAPRISRVPALLAVTMILFLGTAWEDLLWGFQVGYLLSVSSGLAAWVLLERKGRFNDTVAMLCLIVAAGSSSLGIPIMVGMGVELSRQRGRAWIVLVPAALYVLWYLGYGESQLTQNNLLATPNYSTDLAASAFGGLVGRGLEWGRPLALLGLVVVVRHFVRSVSISARLAGLLTAAVTLWIITGFARGTLGAPESSRYVYLGAVLIVLIGIELLRDIKITPRMIAIATPLIIFFSLTGLTVMRTGALGLRVTSETVTAQLGALELAKAYAPPNFQPNPEKAPPVYAGLYLHTVRSIGSSPADTPTQLATAEPSARAAADGILASLETPKLVRLAASHPVAGTSKPTLGAITLASQTAIGNCVRLTPTSPHPMAVEATLPRSGLLIENQGADIAIISLRRFGESFISLPKPISARTNVEFSMPTDASDVTWKMTLSSDSALTVCGT
jgi:hypothetical protein